MLLLTAAENRKILQSMAENKRGLSAGLRPESGGGLFTAVAFLRRINFVQIAARFRRRMAGGQRLVDVPWRHAVDNIGRLHFIAGEDPQYAAGAAVIGSDHRVATRGGVIDAGEVNIVQHRQVGGTGVDVIRRVKQIAAAWQAGFTLGAEDVSAGAVLDHLHQPHGVGMADRIGVKGGFGLHNREDQRLINPILTRGLTHHAEVFMRTFVEVVRHQVNGDAVDHAQAVVAALQTGLQQIVGKARGAPLPANRRPGVIHHLAIEERLFGDLDVIDIGIEVNGVGVIAHQQGFDDSLAQSSARVGAGNGLDGDRPFIEVDVAAGLILVGVLDVVLWPGEQDFVVPPNVLDVVGELAHQNIESVRVLDPGLVVFGAFFIGAGTRNEQRRNQRER